MASLGEIVRVPTFSRVADLRPKQHPIAMQPQPMSPHDLKTIIFAGEGETLEFKREPTPGVGKAVAAFASSRGGTILVGVDDAGEIIGIDDFEVARGQVQNWIHEFVFPSPPITTTRVALDGFDLLVVHVEKGSIVHRSQFALARNARRNVESRVRVFDPVA